MQPYYTLNTLMAMIPDSLRDRLQQLWNANYLRFAEAHGSSHNHQAWEGGYLDHIREVMNLACILYGTFEALRPLPFTLADALIVLFLHDVEKPWKAEMRFTKAERPGFRQKMLEQYGIKLTEDQQIAFKYVEGENDDYTPGRRVTNELGAFCHLCDYTSARIWHNRPLEGIDTWGDRVGYDY